VRRGPGLGSAKYAVMSASILLPDADRLRLDAVTLEDNALRLVLSTIQSAPCCPVCRQPAGRVHSAYVRSPADLPCGGVPLRLELHARRLHCDAPQCPRRIFTERLPGVLEPHAQRTLRLTDALGAIAHALGGKAGARLAEDLRMKVSRDTLLRGLKQAAPAEEVAPRVLGVDDWAKRKGQQYGTILVDLERRCVIDLLPDRQAETLAAWLKEHPGVEIIARDRGGAYAQGAREGAPHAVQVADRFHLLQNLADALGEVLAEEHAALREAARSSPPPTADTDSPTPAAASPDAPPAWERRSRREREQSAHARERRRALYEQVLRLQQAGRTARRIAKELGISKTTVHKYLQAGAFPERKARATPPGSVAPYAAYLHRRWDEGCQNAKQLWRELREQGFPGQPVAVWRFTRNWRDPEEAGSDDEKGARGRSVPAHPAPRAVVWWLLGGPSTLTEEQAAFLERLKAGRPKIELAQNLAREFFSMVRERAPGRLEEWVVRASTSGMEALQQFGAGLRRDWEAVVAGLTVEWSSGPVEGQVNRLKMVKRQMYGRAGLAVLRARMLPTAKAA
jgi:transposase